MSNRKPDRVADNPMILPYGSNVGAPAITVPDVGKFKERVPLANHHLHQRLEEIKKEYNELLELAQSTELCYNSKYNFIPIVGETYYLYWTGSEYMLSLIEPDRWDRYEFVGAFVHETNNTWRRQDG